MNGMEFLGQLQLLPTGQDNVGGGTQNAAATGGANYGWKSLWYF